jgi:two-component system cell cycle response regulator DivK
MANELILIVEDNDKNRKLVRDVLHFKGYRLAEAETGEEGVRLARELHPDLILMDIQLPGINGVTALRQLRADPATRAIPAIAVTASAMTQDRQTIMTPVRRRRARPYRGPRYAIDRGDPPAVGWAQTILVQRSPCHAVSPVPHRE